MFNKEESWCPDICPITDRPFFMWIEHYETKLMTPTYGDQFDSYTIPIKNNNGEYICDRYDHDLGGWLTDQRECIGVKIIDDQLYTHKESINEIKAQAVDELSFPSLLRRMWSGSDVVKWLKDEAEHLRAVNNIKESKTVKNKR